MKTVQPSHDEGMTLQSGDNHSYRVVRTYEAPGSGSRFTGITPFFREEGKHRPLPWVLVAASVLLVPYWASQVPFTPTEDCQALGFHSQGRDLGCGVQRRRWEGAEGGALPRPRDSAEKAPHPKPPPELCLPSGRQ